MKELKQKKIYLGNFELFLDVWKSEIRPCPLDSECLSSECWHLFQAPYFSATSSIALALLGGRLARVKEIAGFTMAKLWDIGSFTHPLSRLALEHSSIYKFGDTRKIWKSSMKKTRNRQKLKMKDEFFAIFWNEKIKKIICVQLNRK